MYLQKSLNRLSAFASLPVIALLCILKYKFVCFHGKITAISIRTTTMTDTTAATTTNKNIPSQTPSSSSDTFYNNARQTHDLKRFVTIALLAMVLYATMSFDSTTIHLYKSTISSSSTESWFFQSQSSGSSSSSSQTASHRQDWYSELLSLTDVRTTCTPGHVLWQNNLVQHDSNNNSRTNDDADTVPPYKLNRHQISPVVHVRVTSSCLSVQQQEQIQAWQQVFGNTVGQHLNKTGYQIVIHDDLAQDRLLLDRYWKPFPHLQHTVIPCASPITRRSLWKALVLYQYGGIVLDLDYLQPPIENNKTSHLYMEESFWNILEDPEAPAVLLLENQYLSNAWLAAPPRHAFFYLWAHTLLLDTMGLRGVEEQWNGLVTTGPSLHTALLHFQKHIHQVPNVTAYQVQPMLYTQPAANNATVNVVYMNRVASWFGTIPNEQKNPLPEELRWGNTDTCLMRTYRVHESSSRQFTQNATRMVKNEN